MKRPFGVLLTYPMDAYLEEELSRRFEIFRLWEHQPENRIAFLLSKSGEIRSVVGNTFAGADAEMIDALPALEIVASFSVGLDMVDCRRCAERGIRVTNTPDVLTDDVADLAIALAIATLRRMCAAERYVRSGAWINYGDYRLCSKFSGKVVGIVGLGRIGSAVARRAEAFGCPIGYRSRTEKPETGYKCFSSVIDLAAESQVLIVSCPLTDETRRIIDRDVINALGPQGVLINVGRGALVDEEELVRALMEGRLGGAGLDVFEREPEVPQQLIGLDNVVLLPHVGSGTRETSRAMADLVLANLEAHVHGKPLLTPVV